MPTTRSFLLSRNHFRMSFVKVFSLLMLLSVCLANPGGRIASDGVTINTKQLLAELRSQQMSAGSCQLAMYMQLAG